MISRKAAKRINQELCAFCVEEGIEYKDIRKLLKLLLKLTKNKSFQESIKLILKELEDEMFYTRLGRPE